MNICKVYLLSRTIIFKFFMMLGKSKIPKKKRPNALKYLYYKAEQ